MAKNHLWRRGPLIILIAILFFFAFGNSTFSQTCTVPDYGTGPGFHWARGSLVYYYWDENSNFDRAQLAQIQAAFWEWNSQTLQRLNCSGVTFAEGPGPSFNDSLYLYKDYIPDSNGNPVLAETTPISYNTPIYTLYKAEIAINIDLTVGGVPYFNPNGPGNASSTFIIKKPNGARTAILRFLMGR